MQGSTNLFVWLNINFVFVTNLEPKAEVDCIYDNFKFKLIYKIML